MIKYHRKSHALQKAYREILSSGAKEAMTFWSGVYYEEEKAA